MKNKEKYEEQILAFACASESFGVNEETGEIGECASMKCTKCKFYVPGKLCKEHRHDWAESEYIEPAKISKRDKAFLNYINVNMHYIARDMDGGLYVYISKPHKLIDCWESSWCELDKSLGFFKLDFPMIKWEDDEPWLIEDLKKLEVCKEYG